MKNVWNEWTDAEAAVIKLHGDGANFMGIRPRYNPKASKPDGFTAFWLTADGSRVGVDVTGLTPFLTIEK